LVENTKQKKKKSKPKIPVLWKGKAESHAKNGLKYQ